MEENKNVQTNVELSDEELEQAAGGMGMWVWVTTQECSQCGKVYYTPATAVCSCGRVLRK